MWVAIPFAVAVYLLTGSALVAALLPYAAAALPSVQSAIWLRAEDPNAARGAACLWFYLASAGWKAAIAAFLTVLSFAVIQGAAGIPPNMNSFARTMITLLTGLAMATTFGIAGLLGAMRRKVRVFVIPNLRDLCKGEFTNIGSIGAGGPRFNYAVFVVACTLVVPMLTAGGAMAIAAATPHGPNEPASLVAQIGLAVVLLGPLAMIPIYAFCSKRVMARHPSDCWPEVV